MELTLLSIVSVAIVYMIPGVMYNLPMRYILDNGIKDNLMRFLVFTNRVHSYWSPLMCDLLPSSSPVVDKYPSLEMKDLKGHIYDYFNGPSVFNLLTVIFIIQYTAST